MASAHVLFTIDQYLRTSYHPDADYVDGEIEERHLGEYEHARLQAFLAAFFFNQEKTGSFRTVTEQRIRVSANTVRICYVAVLHAHTARERVVTTPPLLCIEILSPEDRLSRAELVLADYHAMGVENIWLIDPIRRSAHTFDSAGLHVADPTRLTVHGTPIHLDLTEAFAAID